jgi:hypothetical protein
MATKAQIETNRANALLSSEPVTPEAQRVRLRAAAPTPPATPSNTASPEKPVGCGGEAQAALQLCPLSWTPKLRKRTAPDDGYVNRCKECRAVMTDRRRTYCSAACTRLALTENSKFIVPRSVSPRASFVRNLYRRR